MVRSRAAETDFLANLPLVEEVIRFTVRRYRCRREEAEEFASLAKLKLIGDDYAVFRKFGGRSTLRTYLTTVLQRLFLDYRTQRWGKWRPSARARRLGETAVRLEGLLYRDGLSFEEACQMLRVNEGVTEAPDELARIAAQLPPRSVRRLEHETLLAEIALPPEVVEAPARAGERREQWRRIQGALQSALDRLSAQDRLILRLRFEEGMPPRQISGALGLDPKPLYRRIEQLLDRLRRALQREGIQAADVSDILDAYGFDLSAALKPVSRELREVSG